MEEDNVEKGRNQEWVPKGIWDGNLPTSQEVDVGENGHGKEKDSWGRLGSWCPFACDKR